MLVLTINSGEINVDIHVDEDSAGQDDDVADTDLDIDTKPLYRSCMKYLLMTMLLAMILMTTTTTTADLEGEGYEQRRPEQQPESTERRELPPQEGIGGIGQHPPEHAQVTKRAAGVLARTRRMDPVSSRAGLAPLPSHVEVFSTQLTSAAVRKDFAGVVSRRSSLCALVSANIS